MRFPMPQLERTCTGMGTTVPMLRGEASEKPARFCKGDKKMEFGEGCFWRQSGYEFPTGPHPPSLPHQVGKDGGALH